MIKKITIKKNVQSFFLSRLSITIYDSLLPTIKVKIQKKHLYIYLYKIFKRLRRDITSKLSNFNTNIHIVEFIIFAIIF